MNRSAHRKPWHIRTVTFAATLSVVAGIGVAGLAASSPAVAFADSYGEGDGLNRYVVTLAGDRAAAATPGSPAPTSPTATSDAATQDAAPTFELLAAQDQSVTRGRIDVALLGKAQAQLGTDGRVESYDGVGYYVTDSAAMVVSPGGDGTARPTSNAPAATHPVPADGLADSDAVLAALAAKPAVSSAQRLHDGQVLVATRLDLQQVRDLPQVAEAAESVEVPVAASASDPMYGPYGWNLKNTGSNAYTQDAKAGADINAPAGWDVSQGQGTVVAVVDTGFDSDHPDLVGALWTSPTESCGTADTNGNGKAGDCHGWNFYTNTANVDNGEAGSHGTTVAGTIAARIDNGHGSAGVAPKTRIMPLVVGGGESVNIELAIEAFRYAVDNGADVINASFGGSFGGSTLAAMSSAIDYATAHGVPVVAAAGNDGGNRDASALYPASMGNAGVITVGSTTAMDTPAPSSAYGATSVDLFAPGEKVFTTWNDGGYRLVSGTSIAAPHVAGALALYRSLHPDASVAEMKAAVMSDSTKLAVLKSKSVSGGRLSIGSLTGAGAGENESVSYEFSSMVARPGTVQPQVKVVTTAGAGTYTARLGVAMLVDGEVWAVAGEDITLDGVAATTDDTGVASFSLGALPSLDTLSLAPTLTLGEGKFALTAQILKDGQPMTRPYAAPLVVSQTAILPNPGDVTPGTPMPTPGGGGDSGAGTNPGGGTNPGAGTEPGTGTSPGTGPKPGDGTNPGTGPNPSDGTNPGTEPKPGDSTNPGTGPATPGEDSTPSPSTPVTPNPGTTDPDAAGPGTPTPGGPSPSTPDTPSTEPSGPDFKTFPSLGAFQLTRISPVHVPAAGGSIVEIRGEALESGVGVRVGSMTIADVLSATSSRVTFRSPKMVPGTYDVTVYKNGKSSVLPDALVVGDGTAPTNPTPPEVTDPASSAPPENSNPGSGTTPTPTPTKPAPTKPTPTPTKPPTPGTSPDKGDSGATTPTAPGATRVGPNGERLVRNDNLASLSGLWGTSCATTCSGQQV